MISDVPVQRSVRPVNTAVRERIRIMEKGITLTLFFSALFSIFVTAAIVLVLVVDAAAFFRTVGFGEFLFGTEWTPLFEPRSFGVLPLVAGTFLIVSGAGLIAIPLGLAGAVYLSEYSTQRVRSTLKPLLELLAGIPTIVYGYFALTAITPLLRVFFPGIGVFNAASAAIVVGIMILPMITSLCDDALRSVPRSIRDGGYALGATHYEVTTHLTIPSAMSGIMASFILALSRAIGETMAVTLAAGATPKLTLNPMESIQTMTSYIVQVSLGDTPADSVQYHTIFAVASLLFLVTLVMNIASERILNRFRRAYS